MDIKSYNILEDSIYIVNQMYPQIKPHFDLSHQGVKMYIKKKNNIVPISNQLRICFILNLHIESYKILEY
jgi:hypothetical protein